MKSFDDFLKIANEIVSYAIAVVLGLLCGVLALFCLYYLLKIVFWLFIAGVIVSLIGFCIFGLFFFLAMLLSDF